MPQLLLFTLYAPMAACGEIAVGERRMGWRRPARSAVLGLVGAALGLKRDDGPAHEALEAGYGYGVRTDVPGRPFVDYHSIQVAPQRKGRRFETRRLELKAEKLETALSRREYRADALYTAALWARRAAPYSLEALAEALRRPRFTLYFGRKSAPFGLPLAPCVVEAEDLVGAFASRAWPACLCALAPGETAELAFDLDAPGMTPERIESRRDRIAARERWQFAVREEGIATLATVPAAAETAP